MPQEFPRHFPTDDDGGVKEEKEDGKEEESKKEEQDEGEGQEEFCHALYRV